MNSSMDQPAGHPLAVVLGALLAALDARHEAIPQKAARDFGRPR